MNTKLTKSLGMSLGLFAATASSALAEGDTFQTIASSWSGTMTQIIAFIATVMILVGFVVLVAGLLLLKKAHATQAGSQSEAGKHGIIGLILGPIMMSCGIFGAAMQNTATDGLTSTNSQNLVVDFDSIDSDGSGSGDDGDGGDA
ncbi:hypothetical protein L3V86_08680 [Thiotrichales bacterium 19S11-10]|nr:hypothetical protein [Thiotrichales bacterium 19S11-10]